MLQQPRPIGLRQASRSTGDQVQARDIKNPRDEAGHIVRTHPLYFTVMSQAKKSTDAAIAALQANNARTAQELLLDALHKLEELAD